jgi:hypothetical protein
MELTVKSKNFRRFLIALILVILSPVIFLEGLSIYSYLRFALMPSATEQLLDFVEIPRDTELPRKNPQATYAYSIDAYNTDYHPVENILTHRFPVGTSKQEIEKFSTKHSCSVGTEKIICSFEGVWYPPMSSSFFFPFGFVAGCSDSVYLTFSFDTSNKLDDIEIVGVTNCV